MTARPVRPSTSVLPSGDTTALAGSPAPRRLLSAHHDHRSFPFSILVKRRNPFGATSNFKTVFSPSSTVLFPSVSCQEILRVFKSQIFTSLSFSRTHRNRSSGENARDFPLNPHFKLSCSFDNSTSQRQTRK